MKKKDRLSTKEEFIILFESCTACLVPLMVMTAILFGILYFFNLESLIVKSG
jgi:hypothetical protein